MKEETKALYRSMSTETLLLMRLALLEDRKDAENYSTTDQFIDDRLELIRLILEERGIDI